MDHESDLCDCDVHPCPDRQRCLVWHTVLLVWCGLASALVIALVVLR